ncbi:MMPL family transporter [Mycolicibacterium arseniciresistens]|uniref:MMPL family transporter n=1 Tax=Mycolicibacterium arseniciresistens TaxID=3062257 RepID=A0ABT8UJB1_9MYCO|nr:MMPL family transporter [Mycolicibacterium arseniciresistens]MDO3637893.1 MMPL family transporter [Mycolicibacterium arseniciresistens]
MTLDVRHPGVLAGLARAATAAPRRILVIAVLTVVAAGIFGVPVAGKLAAGGFQDPGSESARAAELLTERFDRGDAQLLITVSSPDGARSAAATSVANDVVAKLRSSPDVASVTSAWTAPGPAAARMFSEDGRSGLVIAGVTGGEKQADGNTAALVDAIGGESFERNGVSVRAGGVAMVNEQVTAQSQRDLLLMESIAIPFSFLVLVWVFGGLLAAALPLAVGVIAIVGALAVLHAITFATDVSIFALNLCMAMGLALAIDYTLLMISRYRDELADGAHPDEAVLRMMMTAGRTVVFSATTVALPMVTMVLFPMYFLKSFAYAGVATVVFAAVAALVVTPAVIVLLGDRIDAMDVRRLARRILRRGDPAPRPVQRQFWYRSTHFVMRRAIPIGLAGITLLLVLGAPFLGVRWGLPDDRVLPASSSAHQVGDQLRDGFADDPATDVTVVLPDSGGITPDELGRYAAELSRVADVTAVSATVGTFVDGRAAGPPTAAAGERDGSAFLTVATDAPLFSDRSEQQLDRLQEVAAPGSGQVQLAGVAPSNRDSVRAITSRLPIVLGLVALSTYCLLFLLTGSVVLPLKAVALNILSLTAAFGAMVWIFQDGHLGAFGTTPTGTLVANIPVLLFCIAFGLSMDYEVFLMSRIREFWLASGRTAADVTESVALGLAHTGRVITAAAAVMSISFAALIAANVSFMRMFGLGLTLAVLADATLVRMILVPAFMRVLGRWNWWSPGPLVRLHDRLGLREGPLVVTSDR